MSILAAIRALFKPTGLSHIDAAHGGHCSTVMNAIEPEDPAPLGPLQALVSRFLGLVPMPLSATPIVTVWLDGSLRRIGHRLDRALNACKDRDLALFVRRQVTAQIQSEAVLMIDPSSSEAEVKIVLQPFAELALLDVADALVAVESVPNQRRTAVKRALGELGVQG